MSKIMGKELPENWERIPLKDAVRVILGQSPKSTTYNSEGEGLPFFQGKSEFGELYPTARKWCTDPKKTADKDDVLVSVRAPVGPANLAPSKCVIGRGLAALRPMDGSESKYFLYLIKRYQNNLAALGTGTTFEAISGDTLKNFIIPFAPPEQQKRIVAKIEELFSHIDAGIESLKKAKQLLKQYRQSVLKAAFAGELTKAWHEQYQSQSVVAGSGSDTPEGWSTASISEVAIISTGKRDANHAIDDGEYKFFTCAYEPLASSTYAFDDESLLLPGNGHNVGEVFYYKGKFEVYQRTYVLHKIRIIPKYLFYHLKLGWRKATAKKQYGTATNYIRMGNFTDYTLPIAPPKQQKRIVEEIEARTIAIDRLEAELDKHFNDAVRLRQSILASAFSGMLKNRRIPPYD